MLVLAKVPARNGVSDQGPRRGTVGEERRLLQRVIARRVVHVLPAGSERETRHRD
jgi:hypothetical protein